MRDLQIRLFKTELLIFTLTLPPNVFFLQSLPSHSITSYFQMLRKNRQQNKIILEIFHNFFIFLLQKCNSIVHTLSSTFKIYPESNLLSPPSPQTPSLEQVSSFTLFITTPSYLVSCFSCFPYSLFSMHHPKSSC